MTNIIIYHETKKGTPCQDGIASAHIAFNALRAKGIEDIKVLGWTYQDANLPVYKQSLPELKSGDTVYLVDFSFSKAVLNYYADQNIELIVLDHHKSALERLQGFTRGILSIDMGYSGTGLTWKYFYPDNPMPLIYQYIQDQDLWANKLPYTLELNAAIYLARVKALDVSLPDKSVPRYYQGLSEKEIESFMFFDQLVTCDQKQLENIFLEAGRLELEKRDRKAQEIANDFVTCRLIYIDSYIYIETRNTIQKLSRIANESDKALIYPDTFKTIPFKDKEAHQLRSFALACLYNEYKEDKFVAGCFQLGNECLWDLRSHPDSKFDCSTLAKVFGGGGHFHAAGFNTPLITLS